VPSGSVFDLGGRDLIVLTGKVITVQGAGSLAILADDITLQSGAKINANGTNGFGGDVLLSAAGNIDLEATSRVDVSAAGAGSIDLLATNVTANGQLRANSTIRDDDGGLVTIQASGNISIAGTGINANGGDRFGSGGLVDLIADGNIMVSAVIEVKGGDGDGGDIDFDALGSVTTTAAAVLNSIATYEFGSGGAIAVVAGTHVNMAGDVLARQGFFSRCRCLRRQADRSPDTVADIDTAGGTGTGAPSAARRRRGDLALRPAPISHGSDAYRHRSGQRCRSAQPRAGGATRRHLPRPRPPRRRRL
jgi:hypothetical protein